MILYVIIPDIGGCGSLFVSHILSLYVYCYNYVSLLSMYVIILDITVEYVWLFMLSYPIITLIGEVVLY